MRRSLQGKPIALALFALAGLLASCTEVEDDNTTNTVVTILSMGGLAADPTGTPSDDLQSDVLLCTGEGEDRVCSVVNDFGVVTMLARRKDQLRDIGQYGDVVFERYRVTYIRADGRNVPGVEVPYAFDGATNFRVPADGITEVDRGFTVVRQQAKLEPPLVNLVGGGGAIILGVIAQIDFFGKDLAGRPITVTGFLNINFADFADEE